VVHGLDDAAPAVSLSPTIEPSSVAMNKMRSAVAGSLKSTIPKITATSAPMPVQTA
jgi:hypothetical protein